ncbi:hypothetical protein SISNIDRAFT_550324 [Sistotremastrum niveocremeum HHB9708]|uniref:F-box domain-containing protein n=1 Tax=Sistotremastrum niveocremeum HHB9708 TaxID=1314777 RepID=A0A164U0I2_9AGAM|nr:hypothetical protein SISNIDRAFT_550324 [Sistotremastrum niveocremeum HHB9708]
MANLLSLPPEILLKTLEGFSVREIVEVSQTCSKLRHVIRSNKSSFRKSRNPDTIHLPPELSIDNVSASALFGLACRSIAISKHLSSSRQPIEPHSTISYNLSIPSLLKISTVHRRPTRFSRCGTIIGFLCDTSYSLIDIETSDVLQAEIELSAATWSISCLDTLWLKEERSVLIAAVSEDLTGTCVLQVDEISTARMTFGERNQRFRLEIPRLEPISMTVHAQYIAIVTYKRLILVDWRNNVGAMIQVAGSRSRSEGDDGLSPASSRECFSDMRTLLFHPREPAAVISQSCFMDKVESGIHLIKLPNNMPQLTDGMSSGVSDWTNLTIESTDLRCSRFPNQLWAAIHCAEVRPPSTLDLHVLVMTQQGETRAKRNFAKVALDISNSSSYAEILKWGELKAEADNFSASGAHRIAGSPFYLVKTSNGYCLNVPKLEDGNGFQSSFVLMSLPFNCQFPAAVKDVSTFPGIAQGQWDVLLCDFELQTGKLFAITRDALHVVQY